MKRAVVIGTGAYLPARIMTNHDFPAHLETNHEWIFERTGIEERHLAGAGEKTSDLAFHAAQDAIKNAGIEPSTIDLVILATTTPDDIMPSTATKVQHRLGITRGAAFDVNAACSGFVYAMTIAKNFIAAGSAKRVLAIGAETYSRILDWEDRTTCILFGDGAAALVLEAQEGQNTNEDRGVLFSSIHSDGQYTSILNTTDNKHEGTLFMAGKEVFRHAVAKMPAAVEEALAATNLTSADIDWLVPHQANMRILASVAQKLHIEENRVISTVSKHANTSAASIPLALHMGVSDGRIKQGQLIACPALGAGLTWGATLIRW